MTAFHLNTPHGWLEYPTIEAAIEAGTRAIEKARQEASDGVWPYDIDIISIHRTTHEGDDPLREGDLVMQAQPSRATEDPSGRTGFLCDYVMAATARPDDIESLTAGILDSIQDFFPLGVRHLLRKRIEIVLKANLRNRHAPIRQAIDQTLLDYRLSNMRCSDDPGAGYPLVDLMTPSGPGRSIAEGQEEIAAMADEIMEAIHPTNSARPGIAGPSDDDGGTIGLDGERGPW